MSAMPYLVRQRHRAPALTERVKPDESLPRVCIIGAGSSGLAAAKALDPYEDDAEAIARRAMEVAAEVCVFTNDRVTVETI